MNAPSLFYQKAATFSIMVPRDAPNNAETTFSDLAIGLVAARSVETYKREPKKSMATHPRDRTPRRTRAHIIADLSVNYIERFFLEAGHSPMGVPKDYGYDLTVATHGRGGYAENGPIYIQLKASQRLGQMGSKAAYAFSITREHYNLWRDEPMPVFLVLYCRRTNAAYWLYLQPYFKNHPALFRAGSQKSAMVHIPAQNRVTDATIGYMRARKQEAVHAANKAIDHQD